MHTKEKDTSWSVILTSIARKDKGSPLFCYYCNDVDALLHMLVLISAVAVGLLLSSLPTCYAAARPCIIIMLFKSNEEAEVLGSVGVAVVGVYNISYWLLNILGG